MAQDRGKIVEQGKPDNSAIVLAYSQNMGFAYHLCNLSIAMRKAGWRIFAFGPHTEQIPGLIDKLREGDVDVEIFDASRADENLINEIENAGSLRRFMKKSQNQSDPLQRIQTRPDSLPRVLWNEEPAETIVDL